MPDDKPSYSLVHQKRHPTILSPKGESVGDVRKGLSKIPELSGGAKWIDPKAIIHRDPNKKVDPMNYYPEDVEQLGEVTQKV
jgi:hypothetical protein